MSGAVALQCLERGERGQSRRLGTQYARTPARRAESVPLREFHFGGSETAFRTDCDRGRRCGGRRQRVVRGGREHEALRRVRRRQRGAPRGFVRQRRQPVAAALATRGHHDFAPVRDATREPLAFEAQHAARGGHDHDPRGAQLDCLFDHPVELVVGDQRLDQRERKRRFAFDRIEAFDQRLRARAEAGRVFAAAPVEQRDRSARAESQHALRVMSDRRGQFDPAAGGQLGADKEARRGAKRQAWWRRRARRRSAL